MPGIIMNDSNICRGGIAVNDSTGASDKGQAKPQHTNGFSYTNGQVNFSRKEISRVGDLETTFSSLHNLPLEIAHISNGFFPLGSVVNRTVAQCWNDLTTFVTELDDGHFQPEELPFTFDLGNNEASGKLRNKPSEMIGKKSHLLDFFQARRAEFIKLLVLSQWGQQSIDVSRLIDLQTFLRMRYDSYNHTLLRAGSMKRDLVRAQMCNPDLKNALKVISAGRVADINALGLPSPRGLGPNKTLKTLQKINKLIRTRLMLHDNIPPFASYVIHNGRVTFTVLYQFEVDLSIALKSHLSQFFFVDIRFLFSPSSPLPKGRIRDDLDRRINAALMTSGIVGCFRLLHNLALTQKLIICYRQAVELTRYHWGNNLRVELLHRTLVIHYWANKSCLKSWIEIGIKSGETHCQTVRSDQKMPFLHLRWICNNRDVLTENIQFDKQSINMESTLRGIVSRHISNAFLDIYANLREKQLYRSGGLFICLKTSTIEPGDCYIDVQLTNTKHVRVMMEPISGVATFQTIPPCIHVNPGDFNDDKAATEDISDHVCRLRCLAAIEEVELHARALGWKLVSPGNLDIGNLRRVFPLNEIRYILLFQCAEWERGWLVAFTSSMDGDNWWIVQLPDFEKLSLSSQIRPSLNEPLILHKAHMVTGDCDSFYGRLRYPSFAELGHAISGMIVVHSNSNYLAGNGFHHFPPPHELILGSCLRVPNKYLRFDPLNVDSGLRLNSMLPSEKQQSIINETVCLSFRGIDHKTHRAIVVAYGFLAATPNDIYTVTRSANLALAFHPEKGSFAIRFLPRVGQPIVAQLFSWLSKLYNMIFALKLLRNKRFDPKLISSNQLSFTYPGAKDLQGCITFYYSQQAFRVHPRVAPKTSKALSITGIHMTLDFNHGSSLQRITEPLTSILNRPVTGLQLMMEFLISTLPLLRALDRICTDNDTGHEPHPCVQVVARTSKVYQLIYPFFQYRFHVTMRQRRHQNFWLLCNNSTSRARMDQVELERELKDKIFDAKGDGWRGLGEGVLADFKSVEDLILLLNTLMREFMLRKSPLNYKNLIHDPGSASNKHYPDQHETCTDTDREKGHSNLNDKLSLGTKNLPAKSGLDKELETPPQTLGGEIQNVITID